MRIVLDITYEYCLNLQFPQRLILIVAEEPLDHVTLKSENPYF
jgi:hypothetical protein